MVADVLYNVSNFVEQLYRGQVTSDNHIFHNFELVTWPNTENDKEEMIEAKIKALIIVAERATDKD